MMADERVCKYQLPLEEVLLVDLGSIAFLYANNDLYHVSRFGCALLGCPPENHFDHVFHDDFVNLGQVLSTLASVLSNVVAQ